MAYSGTTLQLQRAMERAAHDLHQAADALVNHLEDSPILTADTSEGDDSRAALDIARAWRALVEESAQ